jgi:hypothetical protein
MGYCHMTVMLGEVLSTPKNLQVAVTVYVPDCAALPHGIGPLSPLVPVIVNGLFFVETGVLGAGGGCGVAPGM